VSWKEKLHLDNIYLDKENAWIFGVCAGIGSAHNLAPQLVRVCAIISGLFLPKLTIAIYLIAWLVFDDPSEQADPLHFDEELGDDKA
jgi:phage shock protein PspC (stress-responsive transcriptional regulator)|tara:strand:- start:414 stop:674 length:261 start_codon:yes stop_codon:yes gene_type:complete